MNDYADQKLKEAFILLPKEAQDFLLSSEFTLKIEAVSKRFNLDTDDRANLEDEITLVLLKLVEPYEFEQNLLAVLSVNRDIVPSIIKELTLTILNPMTVDQISPPESAKTNGAPENLPIAQSHLEPMILPKNQNPFLPPLIKKEAIAPHSPVNTPLQKENPPASKPQMTPALAAEISNLLGAKNQGEEKPPSSPFVSQNRTPLPPRPEDKMSAPIQKPSISVEMTRNKPRPEVESQGDPYREPIE